MQEITTYKRLFQRTRISSFLTKWLLVLSLIFTCSIFGLSQESTLNNYSGSWDDDASWSDGTSPGNSGLNDDVEVFGLINSYGSLDFNNGDLTITDTLIIYGNLSLGNNADITIAAGGILIVYGDYTSGNQVQSIVGGYFIVSGNFTMTGANNQGSFDVTGGSVFIFDSSPTIKTSPGYVDLNCTDPLDYPANCGYGDLTDLQSEPVIGLFTSGGFLISASGPLTSFSPLGSVDLSIPDEGDSYQWYRDGIAIPGAILNTYTASVSGDYYIEIVIGATTLISDTVSYVNCKPEIWLKADGAVFNSGTTQALDGETVETWEDLSGMGNNVSQVTVSRRPIFNESSLNFNPSISYDGSNDLLRTDNVMPSVTTEMSGFVVIKKASTTTSKNIIAYQNSDWGQLWSYGEGAGSNNFTIYSQTPGAWNWNRDGTHPITTDIQLLAADWSVSGNLAYYVNSAPKGLHTVASAVTSLPQNSRMIVGARGSGGSETIFNEYFDGEIAEVVYYTRSLSALEQDMISSYLAVKYGLTKSGDFLNSAGDLIWDASANASYLDYIVGVGRDDNSGLNQLKSKSTVDGSSMTMESTGGFSNDVSFVISGSNAEKGVASGGPAAYPNYSNRIWKAGVSGTPGNVNLSFDLEQIWFEVSDNLADFALLIDNDGDFSSGANVHLTGASLVGGILSFTDVPLADGQYFSLAAQGVAGPGQVFNGLRLWLKADKGVSGAAPVSAWEDQSGNALHATVAGNGPDLVPDDLNFNPTLDFTGTNSEYLQVTNGIFGADPFTNSWVYYVATFDNNSNNTVFSENLSSGEYFGGLNAWSNNNVYFELGNTSTAAGGGRIQGLWGGTYGEYNLWTTGISTTTATPYGTNKIIAKDGLVIHSRNTFDNSIASAGNDFYIGGRWAGNNNYYMDGRLAEMIVYSEVPSILEQEKIHSYLSLKYGLLKESIDNLSSPEDERDYFASDASVIWDRSANTGYTQMVAGIGRDDDSDLNQLKSRSTEPLSALILEKTGVFGSDLSFVTVGSDGQAGLAQSGPATYPSISQRTWKTNVSGAPGLISLSFDLATLNFNASSDASDFVLLIDSDADFTSGAAEHTTGANLAGGILTFTDVNLADGQYFTIGAAGVSAPGNVLAGLRLWLKADADVVGASPVTEWYDQGPYGFVATVPTIGPDLVDDDINFNPALEFETNDYMRVLNGIFGTDAVNDVYVIAVNKTNNVQNSTFFMENLSSGKRLSSHLPWGNSNIYYDFGTCCGSSRINTSWGTSAGEYHYWTMGSSTGISTPSGTRKSIYRDGELIVTNNNNDSGIGANNNLDIANSHNGNIAELMIFFGIPDALELEKIHSYLSIKYSLQKRSSDDGGTIPDERDYFASNASVIWDWSANTGFNQRIAGIGRDDASDLNQKISKSGQTGTPITMEQTGVFSSDLAYLIWGSNTLSGLNGSAPAGYQFTSSLHWKVNVSGVPGNVSATINLPEAGILNTGDPTDYALLIDTDEDFTSGATEHTAGASIVGDEISFTGISLADGNYLSLAIRNVNTPAGIPVVPTSAYSLRRVVSTYSGPAIEVRRSSDNALQDIGFTVGGDLDETALLTFAGAGDAYVRTWYDQSGYSNNALQVSDALQPMIVNGGSNIIINGRPAVQFDGVNDLLNISATIPSPTNDFSIIALAQTDDTHQIDAESNTGTAGTGGQDYLFGAVHGGTNAGQGISMATNGISNYEHGAGYMPATGVYSGQVFGLSIVDVLYANRRPQIFINSALVRTGLTSARSLVTASTQIGSGSYGTFTGLISEILVFPETLADNDRITIECDQSDYYSIELQIPGFEIYTQNVAPSSACLFAEEEVVWKESSLVNMLADGMSLQKVSGGDSWNANASSYNKVYDYGYLKFVATATNMRRMIGLSTNDPNANYNTIDYAIYLRNDANVLIYENGSNRGGYGTYAEGDTFLIKVEDNIVRYFQNGNLLYISGTAPTLPLIADVSARYVGSVADDVMIGNLFEGNFTTSLYNAGAAPLYQWKLNGADVGTGTSAYSNTALAPGDEVYCEIIPDVPLCGDPYSSNKIYIVEDPSATLIDIYISPNSASTACQLGEEDVVWNLASLNNVQASENNIIKVQSNNSWNGGASSLNVVRNNGYLEFEAAETNTYRRIGLSTTDVNSTWNTIQYAFYLRADGTIEINESGSGNRISSQTYAGGDIFKIALEEGVVKYYQNDVLLYISGNAPTLPLLADVSIYTVGGTVSTARVSNFSTGTFTATAINGGTTPSYQWRLNGANVGTDSPTYTNTGLAEGDTLTCLLSPDLGACALIDYQSNNIVIRAVDDPASIDFYISGDVSASACQEVIEEISWRGSSLDNLEATGNDLIKIQSNSNWNGNASSLNNVYDGGYLQFTVAETDKWRMIGLSDVDVNSNWNTIDFCFYLVGNGNLEIRESGSGNRISGATYATGDTLQISIEAGVVHYYQNGNLLYISGTAPTLPLVADVSIYSTDGTVKNAIISNISTGDFTANVTNAGSNPGFQWKLNGVNVGSGSNTYSNPGLTGDDTIQCILIPDLGGCGSTSYESNIVRVENIDQPGNIDFIIEGSSAVSACQTATEEVVWEIASLNNLDADGNDLVKVQSNNSWNGGAASLNTVKDNGYFEFTASETNTFRRIGLSTTNTNSNWNTIQFAFYLRGDTQLEINESGSGNRISGANYSSGDIFRIAVEEGVVKYYQNGNLLYVSANAPTLPLLADVSLYSVGATVTDALISNFSTGTFVTTVTNAGTSPAFQWKLNGVDVGSNSPSYVNTSLSENDIVSCLLTPDLGGCSLISYSSNSIEISSVENPASIDFSIAADYSASACQFSEEEISWQITSLENVGVTGSIVEKIQGGNNWNAGAASHNLVYDNGYIEFIAGQTDQARMTGLSNTNTNSNYNTIEFAIYLRNDAQMFIYENGSLRYSGGAYISSDVFRISIEAGLVKYYKNGSIVYLSTVSPTLPLLVDVSLRSVGSIISNVVVSNLTTGSFTATATNAGAAPAYQWQLNGSNVGTNSTTYSNGLLNSFDTVTCILTPDLGGCSSTYYVSNEARILDADSPLSINFFISADTAVNACQESVEEVVWDKTVFSNIEADGNNLLKIQDNSWNGDAVSLNKVYNNGSFQFVVTETNLTRAIGLSNVNSGTNLNTIDYAFYLRNDGNLFLYENGSNRMTVGAYSTGDSLKIEVREGIVYYFRNGGLLRISTATPTMPMMVDVSMYHVGSTLEDAAITNFSEGIYNATATNAGSNPAYQWKVNGANVGVNAPQYVNLTLADNDTISCELIPDLPGCAAAVYTSNRIQNKLVDASSTLDFHILADKVAGACLIASEEIVWDESSFVNVNFYDNKILKTSGGNNWNAGGSSISTVADNGSIEFIAGETNMNRMIGLSNTDPNVNYNTIDFAWYLRNDARMYIYQNGANSYFGGFYAVGDTFSIAVESGVVNYYVNSTLHYTSVVGPTLPLLVDISIYTSNGIVPEILVSNQADGSFTAYQTNAGVNPIYSWKLNGTDVGSNSPNYTNPGLLDGDIVNCLITPDFSACSLTEIASNTITINPGIDATMPSITCPSNISANTSAISCTANVAVPDPVYSDNCVVSELTWSMSGATAASSPASGINVVGTRDFNIGLTNISYTVVDAGGNSANCSFSVTVTDNVAPVAVCKDTIIELDGSGNGSILDSSIDGGSTDNCGIASVVASQTNFDYTEIGDNAVTLTVTDIYGNVSTCNATVTVNGDINVPPTSASVDRNNLCPGDGNIVLSYTGGLLTPGSSAEWYSDAALSIGAGSGNNLSIAAPLVTTTYYVRFEGLFDTTTAVSVTVNIFIPPSVNFTAIADVCIDASAFDLTTGTPAGGVYSGTGLTTSPEFDPSVSGDGTFTITYTYTDGNACVGSANQTITVNPLPVVSLAPFADLCIGAADIALAGGNPFGGVYTGPGVSAGVFSATTAGPGVHTITYTYTDVNSCINSALETITVTDTENPTITAPFDVNVNSDAGLCTASGVALGAATTADNCGVASTTNNAPAVFPLGSTTVMWTVTDNAGLTATDTQIVTVADSELPLIAGCPADITVTADGDYCGNTATWTAPTATDNCSVTLTSSHNPGDFFLVGTTSVSYTATDGAGNTATCTFDIIVNQAADPVITGDTDVCTPVTLNYTTPTIAGKTYLWSVTEGTISGASTNDNVDIDWTGTTNGTVTVEVTSGSGCTITNTINVNKNATPLTGDIQSGSRLTRR